MLIGRQSVGFQASQMSALQPRHFVGFQARSSLGALPRRGGSPLRATNLVKPGGDPRGTPDQVDRAPRQPSSRREPASRRRAGDVRRTLVEPAPEKRPLRSRLAAAQHPAPANQDEPCQWFLSRHGLACAAPGAAAAPPAYSWRPSVVRRRVPGCAFELCGASVSVGGSCRYQRPHGSGELPLSRLWRSRRARG
jgi:hypothetical protein